MPDRKGISKQLDKIIICLPKKYPEIVNNCYPQEFVKLFEKSIEKHGHAYCMDTEKERKRISKLIFKILNKVKNHSKDI